VVTARAGVLGPLTSDAIMTPVIRSPALPRVGRREEVEETMIDREALNGAPTLLATIHEFHCLRTKRHGATGLSPDEELVFAVLLELFEPLRIGCRGARRSPIALSVDLDALVLTEDRGQRARAVRISLRRLWIETRRVLSPGGEVIAALSSAADGQLYAFRGRVIRTYPAATIEIVAAEAKVPWAERHGASPSEFGPSHGQGRKTAP
jgi:hypothetical protein